MPHSLFDLHSFVAIFERLVKKDKGREVGAGWDRWVEAFEN